MKNMVEIELFEKALLDAKGISNSGYINGLYNAFDDKTEHHEVMWGLIHLIESYDNIFGSKVNLKILAYSTPNILTNAEEWAKTIYYRLLNHQPSVLTFIEVLKEIDNNNLKTQIINFLDLIKDNNPDQFCEAVDHIKNSI